MNNALVLEPLVLPYSLLLVFAVAAVIFRMAKHVGKKDGVDAVPVLWRALVFGLVLARLGFVYEFRDAYLASPLSVIDIRDGGWSALSGFVGGWFYLLSQSMRRPVTRRPLHRALWTASAAGLVGSLAFACRWPPTRFGRRRSEAAWRCARSCGGAARRRCQVDGVVWPSGNTRRCLEGLRWRSFARAQACVTPSCRKSSAPGEHHDGATTEDRPARANRWCTGSSPQQPR